jgi:hypothetical protein
MLSCAAPSSTSRSCATASSRSTAGLRSPPPHVRHRGRVRGWRHGQYFDGDYLAIYGKGGGKATVPEMQAALGIDWTDVHEELTEAIPPAYTQFLGEQLLIQLATIPA